MPDVTLAGCRTRPLGSYLGALGILRLVGEQADPAAQGWWDADRFVLRSTLDADDLAAFLVHRYTPTPLVSPWNGGSGFGEKDKAQRRALDAIHQSSDDRLAPYRAAIDAAWAIVLRLRAEGERRGWKSDELKDQVRRACRDELPDDAVAWLDASVVLVGDGDRVFPPLLGTGGNDGRFEFSNNYMQRLAQVLGLKQGRRAPGVDESTAWARHALFGELGASLIKASVGQFNPASAGTANTSPFGATDALVNPWEWILLLEGAVMFAGAPARRMSATAGGQAAVPFTVEASSVGLGSAVGSEDSRGEVWMPVWDRPWTLAELTQLIGEGRVEWNGAQARRSVDVVRAVANIGVDRGVAAFERYAISERFGRNMLAVPAGRFDVVARPEVPVLRRLDRWLDAVRRGSDPPASIRPGLFQVERAMFDLAGRSGAKAARARRLQQVLVAVADLEQAVARATRFREEARIAPVSRLAADEWIPLLDDRTAEFRVAAALALQRDRPGMGLRRLLASVVFDEARWRWDWTDTALVPGLARRPLVDVLSEALRRRAIEAQADTPEIESESGKGVSTAFRSAPLEVAPTAVVRFVRGELDDRRVEHLLAALMLLDHRARTIELGDLPAAADDGPLPPAAWATLAPFFVRQPIRPRWWPRDRSVRLLAEARWPAMLAAGAVGDVADAALRRLRIAGLDPAMPAGSGPALAAATPGVVERRLAAALLCPLAPRDAAAVLETVAPEPVDLEGASA